MTENQRYGMILALDRRGAGAQRRLGIMEETQGLTFEEGEATETRRTSMTIVRADIADFRAATSQSRPAPAEHRSDQAGCSAERRRSRWRE